MHRRYVGRSLGLRLGTKKEGVVEVLEGVTLECPQRSYGARPSIGPPKHGIFYFFIYF